MWLSLTSLKFEKPKTKDFANILGNLKIDRSCLVIIGEYNDTLWRSARNIAKVSVHACGRVERGGYLQTYQIAVYQRGVFVSYEQE